VLAHFAVNFWLDRWVLSGAGGLSGQIKSCRPNVLRRRADWRPLPVAQRMQQRHRMRLKRVTVASARWWMAAGSTRESALRGLLAELIRWIRNLGPDLERAVISGWAVWRTYWRGQRAEPARCPQQTPRL